MRGAHLAREVQRSATCWFVPPNHGRAPGPRRRLPYAQPGSLRATRPLTSGMTAYMHTCMATKTISIDIEAYERLRRARRARSESFSKVIKRAVWPTPPQTAGALLEAFEGASILDESVLGKLDQAQSADRPPEDPWRVE